MHKAKKSLGQNFLKSEQALREIIKAGELTKGDLVLEIGPGKGALTERLLEHAGTVVAIEKDKELYEILKIKFEKEIQNKNLILVEGDVLNFKIELYLKPKKTYKIIANIPYNITGAILEKFLTEKTQPELLVLMVQYEVAKRILARDGKESILSLSVKAYGQPEMVMKVPARYFSPAPKVDSAVIKINRVSRKTFVNEKEEEIFWKIIHAGFAHKRKILVGNLRNLNKETNWIEILEKIGKSAQVRAENLCINDWISISKGL